MHNILIYLDIKYIGDTFSQIKFSWYVSGFVQDCSIFFANAMEIAQSCTKQSVSLSYLLMAWAHFRAVKLPWIFPGAPMKVNGAPWNIQGNLTALPFQLQFLLKIQIQLTFRSAAIIFEDFDAQSRYLGHGEVIVSHSLLWYEYDLYVPYTYMRQ